MSFKPWQIKFPDEPFKKSITKQTAFQLNNADRKSLSRGGIQVVTLVGGQELVFIDIDNASNSLRTITTEHRQIHLGNHFICPDIDLDIDTIAVKHWHLLTGVIDIHLIFSINLKNAGLIELFESGVVSANGDRLTEFNNLRKSPNIATMFCFKDPTVTSDGTLLFAARASGDKKSGGILARGDEIILNKSTSYLIKITTDANDNQATLFLDWYETDIP